MNPTTFARKQIVYSGAVALTADKTRVPIFCFCDEPDNYPSIPEFGHFLGKFEYSIQLGGQFHSTFQSDEGIKQFCDEETSSLKWRANLESMVVHTLIDMQVEGDLIDALFEGL